MIYQVTHIIQPLSRTNDQGSEPTYIAANRFPRNSAPIVLSKLSVAIISEVETDFKAQRNDGFGALELPPYYI
jgi:hypothetical protein